MANKNRLIMAWSKCRIDIGLTPDDESMAADSTLFNIGVIRNNTTSLTTEDGDALQAIETGGAIVAEEKQEGTFSLSTEVIEPSDELYTKLGIAHMSGEDVLVDTHIVPGNFSLKLSPKNLGAKGIKAPKCSISVSPSFGDDTGHAVVLNFSVVKGDAGYWYSKFLYRGDLTLDKYNVTLSNTDTSGSPSQTVTVTTEESVVTATSNASWCVTQVDGKNVKIGAEANEGAERTASVTVTAGSAKALITVTQSA